jgi:hypothetical protein
MSVTAMPADTRRLFRLAAASWLVAGLSRPVLFVLGGFPLTLDSAAVVSAVAIGTGLAIAIAAALWLRPGTKSAIAGTLFGFYVIPGLMYVPIIGTPLWFVVFAATGLVALALSAACLWRGIRARGA